MNCELPALSFEAYQESDNIVARLNLPNMDFAAGRRVDVYASAIRGLITLEPDPEKQLKYAEFIDIYTALDDNEQQRYEREYPGEARAMSTFAERFRQQGMEQGREQGIRQGEVLLLLRLLERKFGPVSAEMRRRVESAEPETLLAWSDRVLTATSIDEVLH